MRTYGLREEIMAKVSQKPHFSRLPPIFSHISRIFFGEAGLNAQDFKSKTFMAKCDLKVVETERSNSRETVTVVATINAAAGVMPSPIIFKGHFLQNDMISKDVGVPSAPYAITDSSMIQGSVLLTSFKTIHQSLRNSTIDDKPHIILLDSNASHMTLAVINFAVDNNVFIFRLPSHSSHVSQSLHVCAFGIFKRKSTQILQG